MIKLYVLKSHDHPKKKPRLSYQKAEISEKGHFGKMVKM